MTGRPLQLKAKRAAALLALAACVPGPPGRPATAAGPQRGFFDTRTAPRYGDPRPGLSTYLAGERPRPAGPQHLCVVGYGAPRADDRAVWVHWREGGRLILWDGSDPGHRADRLGWGRRDLDRREMAAATAAEIAASTYLITPAAFDRIVADCGRHGARYTMTMVAPPRQRRR